MRHPTAARRSGSWHLPPGIAVRTVSDAIIGRVRPSQPIEDAFGPGMGSTPRMVLLFAICQPRLRLTCPVCLTGAASPIKYGRNPGNRPLVSKHRQRGFNKFIFFNVLKVLVYIYPRKSVLKAITEDHHRWINRQQRQLLQFRRALKYSWL